MAVVWFMCHRYLKITWWKEPRWSCALRECRQPYWMTFISWGNKTKLGVCLNNTRGEKEMKGRNGRHSWQYFQIFVLTDFFFPPVTPSAASLNRVSTAGWMKHFQGAALIFKRRCGPPKRGLWPWRGWKWGHEWMRPRVWTVRFGQCVQDAATHFYSGDEETQTNKETWYAFQRRHTQHTPCTNAEWPPFLRSFTLTYSLVHTHTHTHLAPPGNPPGSGSLGTQAWRTIMGCCNCNLPLWHNQAPTYPLMSRPRSPPLQLNLLQFGVRLEPLLISMNPLVLNHPPLASVLYAVSVRAIW